MSQYPKTSVIDIAMGVLSNMDPKKVSVPPPVDAATPIRESKKDPMVSDFVPDVSDTQVTDNYIASILEGAMGVPAKATKTIKETKVTKQVESKEEKLANLVERLNLLIKEAKQILSEEAMTPAAVTTGKIAGPKGKIMIKRKGRHG